MEDESRYLINSIGKGELVNPINYEEWINQKSKIIKECDPHHDLMLFPTDDIEVKIVPKEFRTGGDVIPKAAEEFRDDNPHVYDSVKTTVQDWCVVDRRYSKPPLSVPLEERNKNLAEHKYEIDIDPKTMLTEEDKEYLKNNQDNRASFVSLSEDSFEVSVGDETKLNYLKDYTLPKIKVTDNTNKMHRSFGRPASLFSLFQKSLTFNLEKCAESRKTPLIPSEHETPFKLMVTCTKLEVTPAIEPFYATIALFDVRLKKKVSETLHFDLNSNEMLKKSSKKLDFEIETRGSSAIFSITEPNADMFIIIRIEKTLQKDELSDCFEPYSKDTDNQKIVHKNAIAADDFCSRLGKYRMPFLWVGINVERAVRGTDFLLYDDASDRFSENSCKDHFNNHSGSYKSNPDSSENLDNTSLNSIPFSARFPSMDKKSRLGTMSNNSSFERLDSNEGNKTRVISLNSFTARKGNIFRVFKQESEHLTDDDLCKYMMEMSLKKNSTYKKLKFLPINIQLEVEVPQYATASILTPSLRRVQPYLPSSDASETERWKYPVREVEEFPGRDVYMPYHEYKNFLYVYPQSLNFSNRTGSSRNIMCKIQLMDGESTPLTCIYSKSSSSKMSSEMTTCVQYHNKTPDFYEEVKIELPPYLTKNHHLLFKFYHIVCQTPKPGDKVKVEKEVLIGVTWLPLRHSQTNKNEYADGVLELVLGEHKLPVCTDIPKKDYHLISPKQVKLPSVTWVDDHKELFHVRVSTVSSVHQQDERLKEFTRCYYRYINPEKTDASALEASLKTSIAGLEKAGDVEVVRHLYLTLNRLFALIVKPSQSTKGGSLPAVSFKAITNLVSRVHNLHDKPKSYKRNALLHSYIAYIFRTPKDEQEQFANHRALSLSRFAKDKEEEEPTSRTPQNSPKSSPLGVNQRCKSFNVIQSSEIKEHEVDGRRGRSSSVVTKSCKRLHEQIVAQWLVSDSRLLAFDNAWFFFELIIKSMGQHLQKLTTNESSRKKWFSKDFKEDIVSLVGAISNKIKDTAINNKPYSNFLNKSFGYFLQDLFSFMDRGFVFTLIKKYWIEVMMPDNGGMEETSMLKLCLLQVLCQHEHYTPLNLPYPHSLFNEKNHIKGYQFKAKLKSSNTALSLTLLNKQYCERHYIVGLLLAMNAYILKSTMEANVQRAVILLTRDILYRHDNEATDHMRRSRIASLYLPYITIIMDVYEKLWKDFGNGSKASLDEPKILDESIDSNVNSPSNTLKRTKDRKIPQFSTRTILLCVLSILKNCDPDLLKKWWSQLKPCRIPTLISIIKLCVLCFEYDPSKSKDTVTKKAAQKAENTKIELEMMFKNRPNLKHKQSSLDQGASRWAVKKAKQVEVDGADGIEDDDVSEPILCAETSMITLDTIELLVESGTITETDTVNLSSSIVSKILDVILLMMSSNQSVTVMKLVLATQRSMITKFPHIIFEEETDQCSSLCYNLLRHCASFIKEIREEAIASIYLLMRQNYESMGSFSRVKIQLTIALSKLRSSDTSLSNDIYLKKSLKTLQKYAENDTELSSTRFPEQVKEVSTNLFMIMRDTVRMTEVKQDKDSALRIDLMYRIAKGYQNSPALRITWLKSIAKEHKQNDDKCEAAMCYIHAAALISEYMYMVEYHAHMPNGCVAYSNISQNVLQECAIIDDVLKPDEDGMCTGGEFSEKGLEHLLINSAKLFMEANMFENVDEVYKILIDIYKKNNRSERLGEIHKGLNLAYDRMKNLGRKRVIGSFFRVTFYGEKFGDINGVSMIYKEKPFTKLPEISQRLQALYSAQFGDDFEFIADSKKLDQDQLDPYRVYVQVTYVEPYFEPYQQKYRDCTSECANVNKFVFYTPFTSTGSARGNVNEQFKRKTIMTTECSFPYVKNRLEVVHIQEVIMTPIEVATEDMRRKNEQFKVVLGNENEETDVKMLQMIIQGSIGTTVNQGPMEIIQTFLGEDAKFPDVQGKNYLQYRNRLKFQCKHFIENCRKALEANKNVIGSNQEDYQKEMEENLRKFKREVSPYIYNKHIQRQLSLPVSTSLDLDSSLTRTMSHDSGH